jgi:hypothetical protein
MYYIVFVRLSFYFVCSSEKGVVTLARILLVAGIGMFMYGFSLFSGSGSDGAYGGWSVGWSMGERIIMVSGAVIATLGCVFGPKTEGMRV